MNCALLAHPHARTRTHSQASTRVCLALLSHLGATRAAHPAAGVCEEAQCRAAVPAAPLAAAAGAVNAAPAETKAPVWRVRVCGGLLPDFAEAFVGVAHLQMRMQAFYTA